MSRFQQAKREKIWVKAMIAGPSGAGKTYTALRLATGMARKLGCRVAAIDTENGRIRYYADEFEFDDLQLAEPFTPESYIEAIDDAVDAGYKVLIIDSASHEWTYCTDTHSKMPGNSWANWAKITPRHDAFMEKILQCPAHIICTVRGKDEYVIEEKNGKSTPKKVGMGYKQRDNTEYNFTVTFNLAQDTHVADSTKDNTHLFEGRYEVLTEKDGEKLYQWANEGIEVEKPAPKPASTTATQTTTAPKVDITPESKTLTDEISKLCAALMANSEKGITQDDLKEIIKEEVGVVNYTKVGDLKKLQSLKDRLSQL